MNLILNTKKITSVFLACIAGLIYLPESLAFETGDGNFEDSLGISVGLEFSSGDYGTADTTDTWRIPLEINYSKGNFFAGLNTSFIQAESTGAVIISSSMGGRMRTVTTSTTTTTSSEASGMGDVNFFAGYTFPSQGKTSYDISVGIKLATADEDEGLGTGENDYFIEAGLLHKKDNSRIFASLGYQISGDSATVDYDNVFYANVGISFAQKQNRSYGIMLDYAQSGTPGFDDATELSGFMNMELADDRSLYFYVLAGLSDGSPDYGLGMSYQFSY